MKCRVCDAEITPGTVFCAKCGAKLDAAMVAAATAEAVVAAQMPAEPTLRPPPGSRRDVPEEDIWQASYSPKAMIGTWTLCGLATIGLGVLLIFPFSWPFWWAIAAAIVVIWIVGLLTLVVRRLSVRYRLTNHRFFHEIGILRRTTDRIEVLDIDDVTCVQNLLERMVGVGKVRITSSDRTHPELSLYGIDDPQRVAELFDKARREERTRRAVHIESV